MPGDHMLWITVWPSAIISAASAAVFQKP